MTAQVRAENSIVALRAPSWIARQERNDEADREDEDRPIPMHDMTGRGRRAPHPALRRVRPPKLIPGDARGVRHRPNGTRRTAASGRAGARRPPRSIRSNPRFSRPLRKPAPVADSYRSITHPPRRRMPRQPGMGRASARRGSGLGGRGFGLRMFVGRPSFAAVPSTTQNAGRMLRPRRPEAAVYAPARKLKKTTWPFAGSVPGASSRSTTSP